MHPYGYTPFLVDFTDKMMKNRINRISIHTLNLQPSTRWYSGAGVYRDVFLWTGGKVRIEPRDIFITTKSADEKSATVSVAITVTSDEDARVSLAGGVTAPDGTKVCEDAQSLSVKKGKTQTEMVFEVENPALWDADHPHLYTFEATITCDGVCTDTAEVTFGIRTMSVSAEHGLLVNGKQVKLRGGCIHHDHAALGAMALPAAEERKLTLLKAAGFNAVRTAHYPPSLALLEICDRLGLYVMDEAFDMWNVPKNRMDYSLWFKDWWDRDIRDMVLRDRNHPCVISYSVGNEIAERDGKSDGVYWMQTLVDEVKKYDSTRPVTVGICQIWDAPDADAPDCYKEDYMDGFPNLGDGTIESCWDKRTEQYIAPLDMVGYNYLYERYEYDHEHYPDRIMWGSETHALNIYHSWASVMRNNYVIGDFTWTAYDNLGEAGTGRALWARDGRIDGISLADYPWRACYQGDFDLCGYRRPQSYFREMVWRGDTEPRIFTTHPEHYGEEFTGTGWHWYDVHESWTFEDQYLGKPVRAEVYTDADEIRFLLNGKEVGVASPKDGIAALDIPYEKGELTAVSYYGGVEHKRSTLRTVGAPAGIIAVAEKNEFSADNRDLCYVQITVLDADGNHVTHAQNELSCVVEGGELLSLYCANPANEDDYKNGKCHAFEGRALAVVRACKAGDVTLTLTGEGLSGTSLTVKAR